MRGERGGDHRAGGGARDSPRQAGGEPEHQHHPRPSPPKVGNQANLLRQVAREEGRRRHRKSPAGAAIVAQAPGTVHNPCASDEAQALAVHNSGPSEPRQQLRDSGDPTVCTLRACWAQGEKRTRSARRPPHLPDGGSFPVFLRFSSTFRPRAAGSQGWVVDYETAFAGRKSSLLRQGKKHHSSLAVLANPWQTVHFIKTSEERLNSIPRTTNPWHTTARPGTLNQG
ncbi:hypothetical protein NDU88_005568 [Pleurodeles waltl]|uniref:Uncharacterized protein n=1 Tax=Pleurodeles waltl TaxID=8319 RepID=A0AAV7MWV0_PLEWA|nr:hypothetical protein NDU88_005568 [Pleurodeles waltl]